MSVVRRASNRMAQAAARGCSSSRSA